MSNIIPFAGSGLLGYATNVEVSNVHGLFHTLGIPVSGGLALGFFAGFVRTH